MDNPLLLKYMIWADRTIFGLCEELSEVSFRLEPVSGIGTLESILKHMAEELVAWLGDLKKISWKADYESIQTMTPLELISMIKRMHTEWKEFLSSSTSSLFEIDEGDGLVVSLTLDEAMFNLVNHSSYHRGQIVKLLRSMNIEVPITDFYWYKISLSGKGDR